MSRRSLSKILGLLAIAGVLLAGCGGAATEAPGAVEPTEPAAVEPTEPAAVEPTVAGPTELKIAIVFGATIDEPWMRTLLQAIDRIAATNPHGVTITYAVTENVWGDDAERAIRAYAETGEYDIIWPASSYADQVRNVMAEYPDILFAYTGSGNYGLGGNAFWTYHHIHECAYLLGLMAGQLTETDLIGAVAGFPYEDVNDVLNGFRDGARSVNPDVRVKITFIESWYDPVKAAEATRALIATGVDYVYAERYGVLDALAASGLSGFGQYEDQNSLAPDVVVSSTLLLWDPSVSYLVEQWWNHEATGEPYNAPMEPVWFNMAQGGCDIAPYHGFEASIPQSVMDSVSSAREGILAGTLVVPLNIEPPESD